MRRTFIYVLLVLTTFVAPSCKKRVASAPPAAPTEPAPPPLPAPAVSLTADRTAIEEGDNVTLSWTTENASSVRISELGDVTSNGNVQVSPRTATTYTATAVGPGGTATDTVRITVSIKAAPVATAPARPAALSS